MDVRVGCPFQNACLFFWDLEGLTEVFGRMSAGISGPKLPLFAAFSILNFFTETTSEFLTSLECLASLETRRRRIRGLGSQSSAELLRFCVRGLQRVF